MGPFVLKPKSLGQPGLNGVGSVFRFPFLQRSLISELIGQCFQYTAENLGWLRLPSLVLSGKK